MNSTDSEYIFKIDFNKWKLLRDSETGLLKDPVPEENFEKFEYWCDKNHKPVRQIIPKEGNANYADFLNLSTCKLERKVSLTLGWRAYDDEISKEEYEELCQVALLEYHYNNHIDNTTLIPYQRLGLHFWIFKDKIIIKKAKKIYYVNCEKKKVEKLLQFNEEMLSTAIKITEYEFYNSVIRKLLRIHGNFLINKDEKT